MATVDLDLLKKHVRADDFTEDDEYLTHLLEAAETHICDATNRTSDELLELGGGESYPKDLVQAILLVAGHWYNQREAVASGTMTEVPYTINAIVKRYRKLV